MAAFSFRTRGCAYPGCTRGFYRGHDDPEDPDSKYCTEHIAVAFVETSDSILNEVFGEGLSGD